MRFSKFTRGSSVASYLYEKQRSRIQSLYLYFNFFIKIVPFWLRNIRFFFNIQNTWSLFYGRHYSSLHRLMPLHRKMDVKIFLLFIVAENIRSENICRHFRIVLTNWQFSNSTTCAKTWPYLWLILPHNTSLHWKVGHTQAMYYSIYRLLHVLVFFCAGVSFICVNNRLIEGWTGGKLLLFQRFLVNSG